MMAWSKMVTVVVCVAACSASDDAGDSGGGTETSMASADDDGSASASADGPGDASADGSGDDGASADAGDGPVASTCEADEDCYFGDCCSCTPIAGPPPDCSQTGCPSADCSGLTATCDAGQCITVLAQCDPAAATCDAQPPPCNGMLPYLVDGCWAKTCITVDHCDQNCAAGPCPWRCPMGGDELTVVSGDAIELVLENTVDAKQYACMLTFDEESDAFDCTAAITPGGTFVVSMGHDQGIACNSELMSSIAIPTGDPQACTFSCELLP